MRVPGKVCSGESGRTRQGKSSETRLRPEEYRLAARGGGVSVGMLRITLDCRRRLSEAALFAIRRAVPCAAPCPGTNFQKRTCQPTGPRWKELQ